MDETMRVKPTNPSSDANITADYVIIGTGAVGMAFADIILTESEASLILIDSYDKPGGHWNVAYPFVQLHQPASFYGVSSKELSTGRQEQGGLNDGYGELSSGPAILGYYDDIMRHQFLPSSRVQYFPMCDYQGDGYFRSKVSGKSCRAIAARKYVDATHLKTTVPSTHRPSFTIADGANFMAINDLVKIQTPYERYVVIGAGKTGIDACLWLLSRGVDPDNILWVINRDAWFLDRQNTQMRAPFFFDTVGAYAAQMESIAQADDPANMFERLEAAGYFLRLDPDVTPSCFKGATISKAEITQLRRISHVLRMGHVTDIEPEALILEQGRYDIGKNSLFIDCSASAILNTDLKPIFAGNLITPQMIRPYQPVFSAAFLAHLELNYADDAQKNRMAMPLCLPNSLSDYIDFTLGALLNQRSWNAYPEIKQWISHNRLDGVSKLFKEITEQDHDKIALTQRIKEAAPRAAMRLMQFKQDMMTK